MGLPEFADLGEQNGRSELHLRQRIHGVTCVASKGVLATPQYADYQARST